MGAHTRARTLRLTLVGEPVVVEGPLRRDESFGIFVLAERIAAGR